MNHYATSPKCSIWQRLSKKRLPAGYQQGLTLNRLERDILPYQCEWGAPGELLIHPHGELTVQVTERVKTLFMAFIVFSRFSVTGHCGEAINAQISVKTTGSLRRKHIHFVSKDEEGQKLISLLQQYPIISQTLAELDFNDCHLHIRNGVWSCEIEPFTASELVCRIPATRRYLRLTPEQRHRLLSVLQLFHQFMEKHYLNH
ncbi:DUF3156 family protein [Providencia vermicola]|uniref:DUF3156 family protein n=2 Tax=Providencia TaxID=586 RepID=A0AAI9MY15_PROST|nr:MULTISPECIES: DUF3156 family protein [Providencia]ELR5043060.1 DUF3156 family protein [Providencia rettgeri]ELR5036867.1 DUF3156 family protein [Providencia stuartii]ELR5122337.1 DUF3156 family protein [Providencia stuartii]ELR5142556.1 DUF3156 family protein [Providencia stuartii]ELR5292627.1 DUF3156 family protein [Providencia stuartii]